MIVQMWFLFNMLSLLSKNLKYRKNSKYWDIFVGANIVDSDQTALKEQSDQSLQCLPFVFYIFWRHFFIVKLNCFILRTTTVVGLGVPIFRVFTVPHRNSSNNGCNTC